MLPALAGLRTGQHTLFDRIFANELAIAVHGAHEVGHVAVWPSCCRQSTSVLAGLLERSSYAAGCC